MEFLEKINEDIRNFWKIVAEADPKPEPEPPKKSDNKPQKEKPEKPKSGSGGDKGDVPAPPPGKDDSPEGDKSGGDSVGGDIFGGTEMGAGGPPGNIEPSAEPVGDAGEAGGEEEKSKITYYTDKVNTNKIIKNQRQENEPDFDYSKLSPEIINYYKENYIGETKKGSLIISIPKTNTISLNSFDTDVKFIVQNVLPKIDSTIKRALKQEKRVIVLGNSGLPYYNGDYSQDENGLVAWYLNKKYPDYIIYDTWNPSEYEAFVANDNVWKEVKQRTESSNLDIKSALYLYLMVSGKENVAKKIKTEKVIEKIAGWGVKNTSNVKQIYHVAYPEISDEPQTLASYIIKTYLQLLRVNLMQKVLKYEKEGKIVIVLADKNTSWTLSPSFKKSDEFGKEQETEPLPDKKSPEEKEKTSPEGEEGTAPPEEEKPKK